MDHALVVSPHLDDALFSVSAWMLSHDAAFTVATVFAGVPLAGVAPSYFDAAFESGAAAVRARRIEDVLACTAVNADVIHGPFLDLPYQHTAKPSPALLSRWIESCVDKTGVDTIVLPAGVRHPQHLDVGAAGLLVNRPVERIVYAELPYAHLWPELVPAVTGDRIDVDVDLLVKRSVCAEYETQWAGTGDLGPDEFLWRQPPT